MNNQDKLIQRLNDMVAAIGNHPTFALIAGNQLSKDEWRTFAAQRYLSAMIFEPLLGTAMTKARDAGNQQLAVALAQNHADELGMNASGEVDASRAHAAWRKDFYDALGVTDDMLGAHLMGKAAKEYMDTMRSVMQTDDMLVMCGALLALECFFPVEFRFIQKGRDTVFADVFVGQPGDDEAKKAWRARARLYLDDHITHDANAHFPDLLAAVTPYTTDPATMERLLHGIKTVEEAKLAFYDNVQIKK